MRRSFLIIAITVFTMSLFSCTTSNIAEEIGIEELATEGEDGDVIDEEDNS